jgi:hypothetical protein
MKASLADSQVISYPGGAPQLYQPRCYRSGEEFNLPLAYNADANKKSWEGMQGVLETVFEC